MHGPIHGKKPAGPLPELQQRLLDEPEKVHTSELIDALEKGLHVWSGCRQCSKARTLSLLC